MPTIFFSAPFLIGVSIAAAGIVMMAGWIFRLRGLLEFVPGYQMVFATAAAFVLAGIGLGCTLLPQQRRMRVQSAVGALIALLATTVLAEYVFGRDLWIDAPSLHGWLATTNPHPGRAAMPTAVGFLLAGGAFFGLGRTQAVARALIACVALIGLAALAGNALGLGVIFPDYPLAEMSFTTAGMFALLALGQWSALTEYDGHRSLWAGEGSRIIATGTAVVLVIATVAAIGGFSVMQKRTEVVLESWLAENLASQASQVRDEVRQRLRIATLVAGLPVLHREMRAALAPDARGRAAAELGRMGANILRDDVESFRFVAPDGVELARGGTPPDAVALRTPVPGRSDAFVSFNGRFQLESRSEIVAGGERLGSIELRQPLRQMAWNDLWEDVHVQFCAAEEATIRCFPARGTPQASSIAFGKATPQMLRALSGEAGVMRGRDSHDAEVFSAYAPLPDLGLVVVADVRTHMVFAPLRGPLVWLALLIAALCASSVALLFRSIVPLVRRLARSEEKVRLALSGSKLALFEADVRTGRVTLSEQWSVMRGGPAQAEATNVAALSELLHPEDAPGIIDHSRKALLGEISSYDIEHRVRKLDGTWMWIRSRGEVANRDRHGRALRIIGTNAVITERKRRELIAMQAAAHDKLTGLPNRRLFDDRLKQALARAHRSRVPVAVLYVDADKFKPVNDTYGHAVGDALLKHFGSRLAACVRATDTVARIGGDEFAVILENVQVARDAHAVAEKIVAALHEPFEIEGHRLEVSASVGVAILNDRDGFFADALLKRADRALYEAKRAGKDRYALAA